MNALKGIALTLLYLATVGAQAPEPKPDSPAVQAMVARAKSAAGAMWAEEAHFFCEAPRANSPNDPPIEPTKIFDNVYVIGNAGTVVYIVQTSAGLLMFDSLGANQVETQLIPGFQKLGLDPAQVKAVVVAHGHADHFGGSPYFQERGAKVYVSALDWDLMENPPARGGRAAAPVTLPKRDGVIAEGTPIVLGDLKVTPVALPGHTPGAMGFIFPVRDGGRTRIAGLFGGTILTPGPISDDNMRIYLKSVAHFKEETRKAKAEIVMANHPLMDPVAPKLARLAARKPGEAHPYVVGEQNYQRFLDVIAACTEVNLARRK